MPRPSKAMIAAYREMDRELAEGRSAEVVVSRTDLEWAIMWIALSPPDAEKLPEARAAYNRLAATLFDEAGEA